MSEPTHMDTGAVSEMPVKRRRHGRAVYRHTALGGLYCIQAGDVGHLRSFTGERSFVLTPVDRLVDAEGSPVPVATTMAQYGLLGEFGLYVTVTQVELDMHFELVPELQALQYSEIDVLMRQYEEECCDFTDMDWVASLGLRFAATGEDSQVRCVLYALARERWNALHPDQPVAHLRTPPTAEVLGGDPWDHAPTTTGGST